MQFWEFAKDARAEHSENLEQTTKIKFRADKPKVSRRKETFVDKTYPHYNKFAKLTVQEKKFGLLDNSISIEAQKNWQQRLTDENVEIRGHWVKPLNE